MSITPSYNLVNSAGASQLTVDLLLGVADEAFRQWSLVLAGNANVSVRLEIASSVANGRGYGGWGNGTSFGVFDGLNLSIGAPAYELMTGSNASGSEYDISIIFQESYLLNELYLDPTPQVRDDTPSDRGDAVAVLMHEIGHAVGFIGYLDEGTGLQQGGYATSYDTHLIKIGGRYHFAGPNSQAVYGGPVPLTIGNYTHYGNSSAYPGSDPLTGLMNGVVFYDDYAYAISDLDLAILADTGLGTLRDDILAAPGHDYLRGGKGNDRITGSAIVNHLFGDEGNDLIDGGGGVDLLYGGTGNDSIYVDVTADLVFENPGEGDDLVIAANSFYLYDNIERLQLAAGAGNIFGVGNAADNGITGNEGQNLLIGGSGNDAISGGAGVDSLFGEAGNDTLNGDAGIDYLVGGAGDDTLDGGDDADALYGEDGNDILIGGYGFVTDILVGGTGDDILYGDFGGLGDYDILNGGDGNDIYWVDTPADLTFEAAGGGLDTVRAGINGAGYYLYPHVENLMLEGYTPFGVGNNLDNILTGSFAPNYLLGGLGNDILNGKAGNDVMFGEGGADLFVFERGTGGDVIGDFQPGSDRIQLTGLGFANFAQLAANIVEVAGTTAIDLGLGDFIVLNGLPNSALSAVDFLLG